MNFLEKYELLKKSIPVPSAMIRSAVDSVYVDFVDNIKNCFYCFCVLELSDSIYTTLANGNKVVDSYQMVFSEKCYESIDCNNCNSCTYLINCNNSTDCHYSSFLNTCTDCFGCVALTHKKYCIFNRQYTKDEYLKKVEVLNKEKPEKILKQMFELKKQIPHPASIQLNSENSPYGDYIYDSKNCYWGFNTYTAENCGYMYNSGFNTKNCWDVLFTYGNPVIKTACERCYETIEVTDCYDSAFLVSSQGCSNCYYSERLTNCSDCIGCFGLTSKKYCILNNQLTKDKYEKAVKEIKIELGWKI